jgi:hypothetical protein
VLYNILKVLVSLVEMATVSRMYCYITSLSVYRPLRSAMFLWRQLKKATYISEARRSSVACARLS